MAWMLAGGIATVSAQGLIVNEFSNGPASTQEFFELIAVGPDLNPNCGPIDIRGWILDDNNGDFACGPCGSVGIAAGHIRFASTAIWAAIPTGSIIVLYDPTSRNPRVPADDPTDTAPADGVYILPFNHASLEASVSPCAVNNIPFPNGTCPTCSGVATYTGSCYTAGAATTHAGLRNSGDAAQTRNPGGAYYHGVGYGTAASLVTGGPDNNFISGDGTGRYYAFTNTVNNDYRSSANWISALTSTNGESPGVANSVANGTWIASLGAPCPLPVVYASELTARAEEGQNTLRWITALEVNTDRFEIMRSKTLEGEFEHIATVPAAGNRSLLTPYSFVDDAPNATELWYRLDQYDLDGQLLVGATAHVLNNSIPGTFVHVWPNPTDGRLHIKGEWTGLHSVSVSDIAGRVVLQQPLQDEGGFFELELDVAMLQQGTYILQIQSNDGPITKRFVKQ